MKSGEEENKKVETAGRKESEEGGGNNKEGENFRRSEVYFDVTTESTTQY